MTRVIDEIGENAHEMRHLSELHSHALSVIVPFYAAPESPWLLERLDDLCGHFPERDDIEFIVVDSGSAPRARERCRQICAGHGIRYMRCNRVGKTFDIAPVRNFGARHARGRLIMFFDVDFRVAPDFWDRLLKLAAALGILETKSSFLCLRLVDLDEQATKEFLSDNSKFIPPAGPVFLCKAYTKLFYSWLVVDRLHYLSIGGNREAFRGYGSEDTEMCRRLLLERSMLPRVDGEFVAKNLKDFERVVQPVLRYFGRCIRYTASPTLGAGLSTFHLWHPRTGRHYQAGSQRLKNMLLGGESYAMFNRDGEHPPPLIDGAVADNRVLFVGDEPEKALHCLRDIFPILGSPICVSEGEFVDDRGRLSGTKFGSFLRERGISLVLFHDPDKNADRRQLYDWCRGKKLGVLCFGRGVLPNSWFFDENGCGGGSYSASRWDKPLMKEEERETLDYIKRVGGALAEAKRLCAEVSGGAVGAEKFCRFVHFLRYEFYSFAELRASTLRATASRHSPTAALPPLNFYEMRLPGKPQVVYARAACGAPPSRALFLAAVLQRKCLRLIFIIRRWATWLKPSSLRRPILLILTRVLGAQSAVYLWMVRVAMARGIDLLSPSSSSFRRGTRMVTIPPPT